MRERDIYIERDRQTETEREGRKRMRDCVKEDEGERENEK